jgi:hypothetical protein
MRNELLQGKSNGLVYMFHNAFVHLVLHIVSLGGVLGYEKGLLRAELCVTDELRRGEIGAL